MTFKRTFIASAIMILAMVCLTYMSHGENIHPNKPFSTFPKTIGEWIGKEGRFDEKIYEILGVDDSFLGNYMTPDGSQIQLYVGFYQSQQEGDLIHSPKHCMPGAGWSITRTSFEELNIPNSNPGKIKTIKLLLEKGSQKQIVLYWFQSRGRFISSEYMQKIYLVIDGDTELTSYSPTQWIMNLVPNQWHQIDIEAHPSSNNYDVYIDDVFKRTCTFWIHTGYETTFQVGDRAAGSTDRGEAYWDDFVITQTP